MIRPLSLLLLAATLPGCAATEPRPGASMDAGRTARCGEDRAAQDVVLHLDLIEDMLRKDLYHAGLAHLDALGGQGDAIPRAGYLRAELLRRSGDGAAAAPYYQALTAGCLAGLGHHGLGRVAVADGRMDEALIQLALAEQQRPTDARVRNDHGYALLLAGRYAEARARFQTALELGERERAAANLVLTLLAAGEVTEADTAARRFGLDDGTRAQLRSQAAQLRPRS